MPDTLEPEVTAAPPDLKRPPRRPKSQPEFRPPLAVDRLPPHSTEAEQGVLGCLLLAPNECIG